VASLSDGGFTVALSGQAQQRPRQPLEFAGKIEIILVTDIYELPFDWCLNLHRHSMPNNSLVFLVSGRS